MRCRYFHHIMHTFEVLRVPEHGCITSKSAIVPFVTMSFIKQAFFCAGCTEWYELQISLIDVAKRSFDKSLVSLRHHISSLPVQGRYIPILNKAKQFKDTSCNKHFSQKSFFAICLPDTLSHAPVSFLRCDYDIWVTVQICFAAKFHIICMN